MLVFKTKIQTIQVYIISIEIEVKYILKQQLIIL